MINYVAVIDTKIIAASLATKNAWKMAVGSSLSEEEKQCIGGEYLGCSVKADKVKVFCRDAEGVLHSSCHVPILIECDPAARKLLLQADIEKTLTDLFGENSFVLTGQDVSVEEHA